MTFALFIVVFPEPKPGPGNEPNHKEIFHEGLEQETRWKETSSRGKLKSSNYFKQKGIPSGLMRMYKNPGEG